MALPSTKTDRSSKEKGGSAMRRAWPKLAGLAVWLTLIGAYWSYTRVSGLAPLQIAQRLVSFLAGNPLGVFIYLLAYLLRPLLFFPATLMTMAGGYLYGPFFGLVIVLMASNLSSMMAYLVGRLLGAGTLDQSDKAGILRVYAERMRRNSFETVLMMRFIFLPYDLVSYFSGFLQVKWPGFLLATVLGSIPGSISFILFGASLEGNFGSALPRLNPWALGVAALMFVVSLGLSRWFRRREARRGTLTSATLQGPNSLGAFDSGNGPAPLCKSEIN
ncbi:MAG: TVP38/TMEM64 family protein [Chloroflexi bacterium]|nr:TVP38/TMEM64 family protein [Chloroflexota bacterium]